METVEVVIKMPRSEYEELTRGGYTWWGRHGEYIKKGTILPKGHGRLVDEKDLSLMTVHLIDGVFVCNASTIIEADEDGE